VEDRYRQDHPLTGLMVGASAASVARRKQITITPAILEGRTRVEQGLFVEHPCALGPLVPD